MATTIMVSEKVKEMLDALKIGKESYNDVILDLIEERELLSKEFLKEWKKARKELEEGKTKSLDEILKEEGIDV